MPTNTNPWNSWNTEPTTLQGQPAVKPFSLQKPAPAPFSQMQRPSFMAGSTPEEYTWWQRMMGFGAKYMPTEEWLPKATAGVEKALLPFTAYGIRGREAAKKSPWEAALFYGAPAISHIREGITGLVDIAKAPEPQERAMELGAKFLPGSETYKEYQELPWYQQLAYEAPMWAATAVIPGAMQARAALAPAAARGGIRGGAAIAARGALAPVAGVESGISWAINQTVGRVGVSIFTKANQLATRQTLRKMAVAQGIKLTAQTEKALMDAYSTAFQRHLQRELTNWTIRTGTDIPAKTGDKAIEYIMRHAPPKWAANKMIQELQGQVITPKLIEAVADTVAQTAVKPIPLLLDDLVKTTTGVKPTPPTKPIIPETMITPPPTVTGVPMTITRAMEGQLGKMGYSASAIAKMTPEEAWNILYKPGIPKAEVGVPEVKPLTEIALNEQLLGMSRTDYYILDNGHVIEAPTYPTSAEVLTLEELRELSPDTILTAKFYSAKRGGVARHKIKAGRIILPTSEVTPTIPKAEVGVPEAVAPVAEAVTPEDYFNLKFKEPTIAKYLTPQTYYAQKLGVKPLVESLELGKQELDLTFRALHNAKDQMINQINKLGGVSAAEKIKAKVKNEPTDAVARMRDLLNEYEEPPAFLTPEEREVFNFFRNLNRTIIDGENKVYRLLGIEEIPYRRAYVRHDIAEKVAQEIIEGGYPLPEALSYWSSKIVAQKIFNPMEMERLTTDLEEYFSKDLSYLTDSMLWTGLKVIHLSQPLQAFSQQMGAFDKDLPQYKNLPAEEYERMKQISVMPASTKRWVIDYVNQVIKGQQTHFDADIDRLVSQSGFGGLMDNMLKPFGRTLGKRPVTDASKFIGRMTILSVLGLPRIGLARLMGRNAFQAMQDLALYSIKANLKGYLPPTEHLKKMQANSKYLKGYSGLEEQAAGTLNKIERFLLKPYAWLAKFNYSRSQRKAYWACLELIQKPQHRGLGWADPQRTYTEPKGFIYPSEEAMIARELEWGPGAAQHQYIGMAMPEIFRHKTLIPFTRLQSWWMNHFFRFHAEAMHRAFKGRTSYGAKIPWSWRLHYLQYLILGGAILTALGYTSSYLSGVLPRSMSPSVQFTFGAYEYVTSDSEWEKSKAKSKILNSWRAFIPGALAQKELEDLWTGEKPLWTAFFYGKAEAGPPPHKPSWGIPALLPKDPYQRIEDEVWSQYPGSVRRLSDKILELEKTDPREARRLLFENPQIGSQILEARRNIAIAKAKLKREEAIEEREKIIAGR